MVDAPGVTPEILDVVKRRHQRDGTMGVEGDAHRPKFDGEIDEDREKSPDDQSHDA